jgi:hypothetical protein
MTSSNFSCLGPDGRRGPPLVSAPPRYRQMRSRTHSVTHSPTLSNCVTARRRQHACTRQCCLNGNRVPNVAGTVRSGTPLRFDTRDMHVNWIGRREITFAGGSEAHTCAVFLHVTLCSSAEANGVLD